MAVDWSRLFRESGHAVVERATLDARGVPARHITDAVRAGDLLRLRRGWYALPGTPRAVVEAVRIGGRVTCTSALALEGVFAFESRFTHVHLDLGASRNRAPRSATTPLTVDNRDGCELHWRALSDPGSARPHVVGPVDAMIQAVHCQPPWMAVASLDSAVRRGFVREDQVSEIFAALPRRLRRLRSLVDSRSESGIESILRLVLLDAGLPFEVQVQIDGVGRVDFVVDGVVVVETDGREFHGAATQDRDYARDLALVARGYVVIRLNYRQVIFEKELVLAAIRRAIDTCRVQNSGGNRKPRVLRGS